ncbi:hypothetical protein C4K04_4706 [Pseudomonas chlororaphis]|uniref:RHS repeat-associated core domain-containing protein n=1 Tax=Pseudomonas chlororaphis TaxID=587753 RepID=A0A3G7TTY4_9PSED|nr:RHS repeat-associated core domain-containing protein [Pseudomonas chlororaphis]AZE50361.1 hypothetical protein C4K04_4706 [Pseudomonas chlororaphis]
MKKAKDHTMKEKKTPEASVNDGALLPWALSGGLPAASVLGFNGQLLNAVSGTYLLGNGYRAYSPAMRAFYSPDSLSPFGAGGVSRYQYCNLDPINYTDPSGHLASRAGWGIVLGITAIALGVGVMGIFVMPAIYAGTLTLSGSIVAGMAVLGTVAGAGAIVTGALAANASSLGISPEGEDSLAWASLGLGIAAWCFRPELLFLRKPIQVSPLLRLRGCAQLLVRRAGAWMRRISGREVKQ